VVVAEEEEEDDDPTPPETSGLARARSCPDLGALVRGGLARGGREKKKKKKSQKGARGRRRPAKEARAWEALLVPDGVRVPRDEAPLVGSVADEAVLRASQQDWL
jgi:hypothetical protein